MPNITTLPAPVAEAQDLVPVSGAPPLDQQPAAVYLASLAVGGRRGMAADLERAANILSGGLGDAARLRWQDLRFQHVAAIRRLLVDQGKAPATVGRMLAALRGVSTAAWRLGIMDGEALARIKDVAPPKARRLPRGRHVDAGEIAALFRACGADAIGARDAAMLSLLYGGGLRRSEAVTIRVADYDRATGALTVLQAKGGAQRVVHMTNGGKRAVDVWLAVRGDHAGPLLATVAKGGRVDREGGGISGAHLQARLKVLAERAGVAALSPHDLRRSFVGELLTAGADVGAVQGLAGHASVTTTLRYDRRPDAARRKAAELLHVPYQEPAA